MLANIKRFKFLDQLEILQADNYQEDFPLHLHEKVCITLITQGAECTQVHNQDLISTCQGISLTYANEIHANPNRNDGSYSFLTYYVSPDVISYLFDSDTFFFKNRVLHDKHYYQKFLKFSKLSNPTEEVFIKIFEGFLRNHFTTIPNDTISDQLATMNYTEVVDFIDANFFNSISLEQLAKMKDMSIFSFIRNFKKVKGITPAQYITLRRVEHSKKILREGNSIVNSALEAGFYDQSHLSRNFKKITGITPRMYQKGCNIVQEN